MKEEKKVPSSNGLLFSSVVGVDWGGKAGKVVEYPPENELCCEKFIAGVGVYVAKLKFYFLFSDGSSSWTKEMGEKSKFKEFKVMPQTAIRRIKI